MATFKSVQKPKLEKYFEMREGYVCDFSNRTFAEFILESTGIDIYNDKYASEGNSKASRLRVFWKKESTHLVKNLLLELLEYWKGQKRTTLSGYQPFDPILYQDCKEIIESLQDSDISGEDLDIFDSHSKKIYFAVFAKSIKESIEKNQPEQALDRLHTFVVRYMRALCSRHAIQYDKEMPLHSLFGSYIKFLKNQGLIESEMSEKILKSSIAILDSFNSVRNNQSLAHDNTILNHDESLLIFSYISSTLRFLEAIEKNMEQSKADFKKEDWEEIITYNDNELDDLASAWMEGLADQARGK